MARKLVVLSDGSWIAPQFRSKNRRGPGNATRAFHSIAETHESGDEQIRYLHDLEAKPGAFKRLMQRTFGLGMKAEIFNSYTFLSHNYRGEEDEIYLFGAGLGACNIRRLTSPFSAGTDPLSWLLGYSWQPRSTLARSARYIAKLDDLSRSQDQRQCG